MNDDGEFFDDDNFVTDSDDDDAAWIEDAGEFGQIEIAVNTQDAFMFDEQSLKTHVHNILVNNYKNRAYHKRWIHSFDKKVRNYVELLMNSHAAKPMERTCSFQHPLLRYNKIHPITRLRHNVVENDEKTPYKAFQKTWTEQNAEISNWKDVLTKWHETNTSKTKSTSMLQESIYRILSPFEVDDTKTLLICEESTDILNYIERTDGFLFSYTKALGPHPSVPYEGDRAQFIGAFVNNAPYKLAYDQCPTFDVATYRQRFTKLKVGRTAHVYFHDFVEGVDTTHHEYMVTKVTEREIFLSPISQTEQLPELTYNKEILASNSFLVADKPLEIPKSEWPDSAIAIIFDSTHDINDQLNLSVTTPMQRLFWVIQQKKIKYYELQSFLNAYLEFGAIRAHDYERVKSYVETMVGKLPPAKGPRSVTFTPPKLPVHPYVDILDYKGFKWENTLLDTPYTRVHEMSKRKDYGLHSIYKAVLKDVERQIAHLEHVAEDSETERPESQKLRLGTSLQEKYPEAKLFRTVNDVVKHPPKDDGNDHAILDTHGIRVLLQKREVDAGDKVNIVWEVADQQEDDSDPVQFFVDMDVPRMREQAVQNTLHETYYKNGRALRRLKDAKEALEKEVSKWKGVMRKQDWTWSYTPPELEVIVTDDREMEGEEDEDMIDLQEGEGFGIYYSELRKMEEEDDDEILLDASKKEVDMLSKNIEMYMNLLAVTLKKNEYQIVANYTILHHNIKKLEKLYKQKIALIKTRLRDNELRNAKDKLKADHEANLERNSREIWFTYCAFGIAFALIHKPKPIINPAIHPTSSIHIGKNISKEGLIRYMATVLKRLSSVSDNSESGLASIQKENMSVKDIQEQIERAYEAALDRSQQLTLLLERKGKELKDTVKRDMGKILGTVWSTYRPASYTDDTDKQRTKVNEQGDKKHVVASRYVMHMQHKVGANTLLKQSFTPACCLELVKSTGEFWQRLLDTYEQKSDIVQMTKQLNKQQHRNRMHVHRYHILHPLVRPAVLDKDFFDLKGQAISMDELVVEEEKVSLQSRILEFCRSNPLFTEDETLRAAVAGDMDHDEGWNELNVTIEEMNEKIDAVLDALRDSKLKQDWAHFTRTTLQISDEAQLLNVRDLLFHFIQNDVLKLFARSLYDHKVDFLKNHLPWKKFKKEIQEYLIEELKNAIFHGEDVVSCMSVILDSSTMKFDQLRFCEHSSSEVIQHNVLLLSYIFAKFLLLLIESVVKKQEVINVETYDWNDFIVNKDAIREESVRVVLIHIMTRLFQLFENRRVLMLMDNATVIAEYERQREEKKQQVMSKMERMSRETKQFYMQVKNKALAKFVNMDTLADLQPDEIDMIDEEGNVALEVEEGIDVNMNVDPAQQKQVVDDDGFDIIDADRELLLEEVFEGRGDD